jgi:hypothetical protein
LSPNILGNGALQAVFGRTTPLQAIQACRLEHELRLPRLPPL